MKKKLVSLLVAGTMVAPVIASAQVMNGVGGPGTHVTIFGRVQLNIARLILMAEMHKQVFWMMLINHAGVCMSVKILVWV